VKRSRSFPKAASSVAAARRFVAEALSAASEEARETATLLVSELVTNAIVHADSGVTVTVVSPTSSGGIRVDVEDRSTSRPVELRPSATTPHGRGVQLVSALSDEWGVLEAPGRGGKTVWFELSAPEQSGGRKGRRNLQSSQN
jgi:anti-sigma regulatory factor (Ser/Thr protein kinase)